jgi:hypothetical protein
MGMELKAGTRLRSAVCETEVVVVKAPSSPIELCCGGAPMVASGEQPPAATLDPTLSDGTLLGKRYVHDDVGLEVLCTKPGQGSLSVDSVVLPQKDAKPLPSSD